MVDTVLIANRGEAAMWALVVLAIYLTPFFLLGWAIDAAMKRTPSISVMCSRKQAPTGHLEKCFSWALGGLKSKIRQHWPQAD